MGNKLASIKTKTVYEKFMDMKSENERLKERVKFLENLIKEYTEKMLNNLK